MSRIGKKPIEIPKGVDIKLEDANIKVKGPKGETSSVCPAGIKVSVNEGKALVERLSDEKNVRALHGLTRSLVANMITGVSVGYQKMLNIVGTGYRAQIQGNKIMLSLGFSHPVEFELPAGMNAAVDQKQVQITLTGIDKQQLGQITTNLKTIRPPDAYKGKGVRYSGERLKLKVGKAGKK
ncbi:MAG: 50S ribosomal protein L6 [Nitrospirae bacterium]|nr:50S ribosomal protein L6 [Nitrospirota bacterium]